MGQVSWCGHGTAHCQVPSVEEKQKDKARSFRAPCSSLPCLLPPCNIHAWKLDVQDEHSLHLWCNPWQRTSNLQASWMVSIAYTTFNSPVAIGSCKMLLSCTKRFCRVFRPSSNTFLMDSKSVCAMEMVPPLRGARRKRILTPANKNFTFSTISRSAEPSSWRWMSEIVEKTIHQGLTPTSSTCGNKKETLWNNKMVKLETKTWQECIVVGHLTRRNNIYICTQ